MSLEPGSFLQRYATTCRPLSTTRVTHWANTKKTTFTARKRQVERAAGKGDPGVARRWDDRDRDGHANALIPCPTLLA